MATSQDYQGSNTPIYGRIKLSYVYSLKKRENYKMRQQDCRTSFSKTEATVNTRHNASKWNSWEESTMKSQVDNVLWVGHNYKNNRGTEEIVNVNCTNDHNQPYFMMPSQSMTSYLFVILDDKFIKLHYIYQEIFCNSKY